VRRFFDRLLLLAIAGVIAASLLSGCAWHPHKPKSFDRSISDDDRDPTYRADPERADEEQAR